MKRKHTQIIKTSGKEPLGNGAGQELVGKRALLKILFPNEADRPSLRWLDTQCAKRAVPFMRFGRLIWFSVAEVRSAFSARTIAPRGR